MPAARHHGHGRAGALEAVDPADRCTSRSRRGRRAVAAQRFPPLRRTRPPCEPHVRVCPPVCDVGASSPDLDRIPEPSPDGIIDAVREVLDRRGRYEG